MARAISFRQLVIEADPDWVVESRIVEEYRFSRRTFKSDYRRRGAYTSDLSPGGDQAALLNWGDQGNGAMDNWGDQGAGSDMLAWGDQV